MSYAAETLDISRLDVGAIIPALDFEATRLGFTDAFLRYWEEERAADPTLPAYDTQKIASEAAMRIGRASSWLRLLERAAYDDRIRNLLLGWARGPALDLIGTTYYGVERMIVPADPVAGTAEIQESDDRYTFRLRLAPEAGLPRAQRRGAKLGVAKSLGGYVFHTMSCDLRVRMADAASLERGNVTVAVLAEDGQDPDVVTAAVRSWLFREDVKGATDILVVRPADVLTVDTAATLYALHGPDGDALKGASEAGYRGFVAGRNLFRAPLFGQAIDAALKAPGVERLERSQPPGDVLAPFGTSIRLGRVDLTVARVGPAYG